MKLTCFLAATAMIAAPPVALAAPVEPIVLGKIGGWVIDYDDDSCHLLAKFGEGPQTVVMRMTRFSNDDTFDLTLFGEPLQPKGLGAVFELGFQPTAKLEPREGYLGATSDKQPLVKVRGMRLDNWWIPPSKEWTPGEVQEPPAIAPDRESAITALHFRAGTNTYGLATGSMAEPMQALRACTLDLIKSWGFDPQVLASLSKKPQPTNYPGNWATTADYPPRALRERTSSLVQFRLHIDEQGKITDCKIIFRTGPEYFGDHTCKILRMRAKFSAALDRDGKPVRATYVGRVNWALPEARR